MNLRTSFLPSTWLLGADEASDGDLGRKTRAGFLQLVTYMSWRLWLSNLWASEGQFDTGITKICWSLWSLTSDQGELDGLSVSWCLVKRKFSNTRHRAASSSELTACLLSNPAPALLMFCINAALFLVSSKWKQKAHSAQGSGCVEYDTYTQPQTEQPLGRMN